jgi:hypothetical protein
MQALCAAIPAWYPFLPGVSWRGRSASRIDAVEKVARGDEFEIEKEQKHGDPPCRWPKKEQAKPVRMTVVDAQGAALRAAGQAYRAMPPAGGTCKQAGKGRVVRPAGAPAACWWLRICLLAALKKTPWPSQSVTGFAGRRTGTLPRTKYERRRAMRTVPGGCQLALPWRAAVLRASTLVRSLGSEMSGL